MDDCLPLPLGNLLDLMKEIFQSELGTKLTVSSWQKNQNASLNSVMNHVTTKASLFPSWCLRFLICKMVGLDFLLE